MIEYENLRASNQDFFEDYRESFLKTMESGWYILGKNVKTFEEKFADYVGRKHGVGVASGLDALVLALRAFDFEPDAEVIVPSNTYIATIIAVVRAGLTPVLAEPDLATYNVDPKEIEANVTPKTRAIMVVHLYGKCCDMDPIMATAKKHNLRVIEDCAQSHGATYKGRQSGSFGDYGAFSFYPTKNLGALGDAGAMLCDDDDLATTARRLRNYGSDVKYHNEIVGDNSRLDEVQAGFLLAKFARLEELTQRKRALAKLYHDGLKDDFVKPVVDDDYRDVYHIYNVRHPKRDELREFLLKNEIKTETHYPVAPHKQKAMRDIIKGDYPISEEIHATTLSLPISYGHTATDVERVIETMNKF